MKLRDGEALLDPFLVPENPGIKNADRPILQYLLLPKCKSLCSVTSLQMFFHSIWARPTRAPPNWALAPLLPRPIFVTKQLIAFKRWLSYRFRIFSS